MTDIANDPRLDPRIKAALALLPSPTQETDVVSRDAQLAEANTPEAKAAAEQIRMLLELADNEALAPSTGLAISEHEFTSLPDGNTVKIRFVRPEGADPVPCVYYIHGGGMMSLSCFYGNYRAWSKIIAANGVAVAMGDFRNALVPSSAPEVAPFPAGLNDCVSGLRWLHAQAETLVIDAGKIVIAGESGGGNLTIATGLKLKQDGDLGLISGLYARCPYIAGSWPREDLPSSTENNGILIGLHSNRGAMAYGIEAFNEKNPLAPDSIAVSMTCPRISAVKTSAVPAAADNAAAMASIGNEPANAHLKKANSVRGGGPSAFSKAAIRFPARRIILQPPY